MMTLQKLNELKAVDIRKIEKDMMTDMKDIVVSSCADRQRRMLRFLDTVKNPYCLSINGLAVKFSFADDSCGLEERLKGYLRGKTG